MEADELTLAVYSGFLIGLAVLADVHAWVRVLVVTAAAVSILVVLLA